MFYKIDFKCQDEEKLQNRLNALYHYKKDIGTKVMHRNRMNLFCLLMEELIQKNVIESFDSAIDIGCNSGAYSKIISDFGFKRVLGIDIAAPSVEKANRFFAWKENEKELKFKTLNAENMDKNSRYDFVLCTEVIEHADNPHQIVETIQEILAPKGVAMITLPNRISFPYAWVRLHYRITNRKMDRTLKQHLDYPFYKSLNLFKGTKLKIVRTSGTNLMLYGFMLRFLYRTPAFAAINRAHFHLSRVWPLKYFTQFFFMVLKNQSP